MNDSLEARLQTTLNMIPAYTWYATRSGGLIFLMLCDEETVL